MTPHKETNTLDVNELARAMVEVIADRQGVNTVLLDLRGVSIIADYFIITTGETERQIKAILDAIDERFSKEGIHPLRIEGTPASGWMIMDYGAVVVHVFAPDEREYYQLEHLWREATLVVRIQ